MNTRHGRSLSISAILLLMAGCATPGPPSLPPAELARLVSQSEVTLVHYPTPPFRRAHPATEGRWLIALGPFGIFGAAAAAQADTEAGERVRVQIRLDDPAGRVRERFVDRTMESLRSSPERFLSTDEVGELKATLRSGVVLDFRTLEWAVVAAPKFIPFTAEHYQVSYMVRARLVRLEDPKVVWQATCASQGRDAKAKWTMEELTANEGVLLKEKLAEAAEACADELTAKFQGSRGDKGPGSH